MELAQLQRLYYITCFENVPSMLEHGLLSHERADGHLHTSIASQTIQDRRVGKVVAGRQLHSYANLYIWARNAMLWERYMGNGRRDLCVLSISPKVTTIDDVVVTDRNAASDWHRAEYVASGGLEIVNHDLTFAERWTHTDAFEYWRRKSACQAEMLVPDVVPPEYIQGAFLPSRKLCEELHAIASELPLCPWPYLFFNGAAAGPEALFVPPEE